MQKDEQENACTSQSNSIYGSFEKTYSYECFLQVTVHLLSILVWMCHSRALNYKTNRIVYNYKRSSFQNLLTMD